MFICVTKCVTERDGVTKTTKFDKFMDKFLKCQASLRAERMINS